MSCPEKGPKRNSLTDAASTTAANTPLTTALQEIDSLIVRRDTRENATLETAYFAYQNDLTAPEQIETIAQKLMTELFVAPAGSKENGTLVLYQKEFQKTLASLLTKNLADYQTAPSEKTKNFHLYFQKLLLTMAAQKEENTDLVLDECQQSLANGLPAEDFFIDLMEKSLLHFERATASQKCYQKVLEFDQHDDSTSSHRLLTSYGELLRRLADPYTASQVNEMWQAMRDGEITTQTRGFLGRKIKTNLFIMPQTRQILGRAFANAFQRGYRPLDLAAYDLIWKDLLAYPLLQANLPAQALLQRAGKQVDYQTGTGDENAAILYAVIKSYTNK